MSSPTDSAVTSRRGVLRACAFMALTAGTVLALVLFHQYVDVYFTFGGEPVVPTAAERSRYVWTAGAGLVAMLACLVLAMITSSKGLGWCGFAGLVVTVIAAGVFSVPQDRWHPEPPTYDMPEDYTPCYSGSEDCGPGG